MRLPIFLVATLATALLAIQAQAQCIPPPFPTWPNHIASNGYVALGGTFYLQWGSAMTTSDSAQYFSFNTEFPTRAVHVGVNFKVANPTTELSAVSFNKTGFIVDRNSDILGNLEFTYFAMGYNALCADSVVSPYVSARLIDPDGGYINMQNLVFQWGTNFSTQDTAQPFDLPLGSIWTRYSGVNLALADIKTQLSAKGASSPFVINRDASLNGDIPFDYGFVTVAANHTYDTPNKTACYDGTGWCFFDYGDNYDNGTSQHGYAFLNYILLQWGRANSTINSGQLFPFSVPFGAIPYHVGINIEASDIAVPLTSNWWNETHFQIDRDSSFGSSGYMFNYIAIGPANWCTLNTTLG